MSSASTDEPNNTNALEQFLNEDSYEEHDCKPCEEIEDEIIDLLEKVTPLIDLM